VRAAEEVAKSTTGEYQEILERGNPGNKKCYW
jgi:hypothetical protein